jgi:hypothetical protein
MCPKQNTSDDFYKMLITYKVRNLVSIVQDIKVQHDENDEPIDMCFPYWLTGDANAMK